MALLLLLLLAVEIKVVVGLFRRLVENEMGSNKVEEKGPLEFGKLVRLLL